MWRLTKTDADLPSAGSVCLTELETRCLTLAQLVSGMPLMLKVAEAVGGIRGRVLLLPAIINIAPSAADNRKIFLLRAVINATMVLQWNGRPPDLQGMDGRVRYLFALRRAINSLAKQFDGFERAYAQALFWELTTRPDPGNLTPEAKAFEALRREFARGCDLDQTQQLSRFKNRETPPDLPHGFLLWGETLTSTDAHVAALSEQEDPNRNKTEDGSEVSAPPKDHVVLALLEKVDEVPPLPLHTFEKTETLDTYNGGLRQVDGEDELEEHLEALNELDLREVVRGGPETRGFYQADIDLGEHVPDIHHILPEEKGIPYPEWHFKTHSYRPDWVTVYPTQVLKNDAKTARSILGHHRGQIQTLTNRLLAHRNRNCNLNRQTQGEELDLDAIVEAYADRKAGFDPGERLYRTLRKLKRETAITLLFDISLSSGSWVEGRRVLDVTREAVLILGEVAENLNDQFRVLCFASNTRNHCRVFEVKGWQETWQQVRGRVCGVDPQGYTRIGPALRHGISGFDQVEAKRRGLLIITDGKPTDYDRYEGRYGRQDVKMAILEGNRQGIHTHALALDVRARQFLPTMFGTGGWQVLRHISGLTEAAVNAYARFHRP